MIVHIFIYILCCITVVNQAITELVEELKCRDLDTIELTVTQEHIDRLLGETRIPSQEIIVKDLCEQIPSHHSEPRIPAFCEPDQPARCRKLFQILCCGRAE